jgi:integrase
MTMKVAQLPYMQMRKGSWRYRRPIPKHLQAIIGRGAYWTKSFGTGNYIEASKKWAALNAEVEAAFERAERSTDRFHHPPTPWSPFGSLSKTPPSPETVAYHRAHGQLVEQYQQALTNGGADEFEPIRFQGSAKDPITFVDVIEKWAGRQPRERIESSSFIKDKQDKTTKAGHFAEFLGHDDITRVAFSDCQDWLDDMTEREQAGEIASASIKNHLKQLNPIFKFASRNQLIKTNPIADLEYTPGEGAKREDFTEEERRTVLLASRKADITTHWGIWFGAFHGVRNGEIFDAHTNEFQCHNGVWVWHISEKHRDTKLKTKQSKRDIPIHSAIIAEGFIDYLQSLPEGFLFPSLKKDAYGRRAGNATTEMSDWMRNKVHINNGKTYYCLRHVITTELRAASADISLPCSSDIERYLLAHGGDVHSKYGKQLIPTLKAAVECVSNPL